MKQKIRNLLPASEWQVVLTQVIVPIGIYFTAEACFSSWLPDNPQNVWLSLLSKLASLASVALIAWAIYQQSESQNKAIQESKREAQMESILKELRETVSRELYTTGYYAQYNMETEAWLQSPQSSVKPEGVGGNILDQFRMMDAEGNEPTRKLWVFYGTDREPRIKGGLLLSYLGRRNTEGAVETGKCEVSIPVDAHVEGKVESAKFRVRENPMRHFVIESIGVKNQETFASEVDNAAGSKAEGGILLFVHGFNVNFDEAIKRTAQLAHDLEFNGAPVLFSWPSKGTTAGYFTDEATTEWSAPHLAQFIAMLIRIGAGRKLHVIAHSMGNRVLTRALQILDLQPDHEPGINQVIVASPDMDAQVFREQIAPSIIQGARRVTMYCDQRDHALR